MSGRALGAALADAGTTGGTATLGARAGVRSTMPVPGEVAACGVLPRGRSQTKPKTSAAIAAAPIASDRNTRRSRGYRKGAFQRTDAGRNVGK